jgi:carboxylesterase type B
VTLGGDSAGGGSVDLHLSAYGGRDDGLFHAAAAESQSFATQNTVAGAQYQYDALVQRAGCQNSTDTLLCLRGLSAATLQSININIPNPNGTGLAPLYMYSTVIDGDFSRDFTYREFANGHFIKVPVIFG